MSFSISDAKNEAGEWMMSPEQIRAEMAANTEPYWCDDCGIYHPFDQQCGIDYDEEDDD